MRRLRPGSLECRRVGGKLDRMRPGSGRDRRADLGVRRPPRDRTRPDALGSCRCGSPGWSLAPGRSAVEDELIRVCALAARLACQRMTPRYLKALGDSPG